MNAGRSRELKKTKIEIIPMIDTMFFLLVFFILSSLGVIKLQGINVDLPRTAPSMPSTPDKKPISLTVAIDAKGAVTVNALPVGPNQSVGPILRREYQRQAGENASVKDASVTISADFTVPHGTVVRCIDQARNVGIIKVAFAAPPNIPTAVDPNAPTPPNAPLSNAPPGPTP